MPSAIRGFGAYKSAEKSSGKIAGTLLVTAEAFRMSLGDEFEKRAYALFVIYVVLAFLAQATVGALCCNQGYWVHRSAGLPSFGTWGCWLCFP